MNEMQVFTNPEFGQVRTLAVEESPWFVGKDVAIALGYQNGSKAVIDHVDTEDKKTEVLPYSQNGKTVGKLTIINESGLYSLILSSKLPSAKRFKRWVTSEVLPAIRRTGAYTAPSATPTPQREFTTDDYIRAASIIAGCKNERLPYVLNLLTQGGFTVPTVERIRTDASKDTSGECARLINQAISDYGMGTREIGRLTGLAATQIQRIRTAQSIPTVARSNIIIAAIKNAVPEIE